MSIIVMNRKILFVLVVVAVAVAAGSLAGFGWLYQKVRAYEREHGVQIVSCPQPVVTSPVVTPPQKIRSVDVAVKTQATNAVKKAELKVCGVNYAGETELRVVLSERPDMNGIRRHVNVEPLNEGFVGVSYEANYNRAKGCYEPSLVVTGDFAHNTNVTLRVRRGLSLYGKGANPQAEGSLAQDFIYTFRRKDLRPHVSFAADGRYLPPCGERTIGVESVNIASVRTEVRRVEPRNVVQMLAREEDIYEHYHGRGGDSRDTIELSGEVTTHRVSCVNKLNKKETAWMSVAADDGGPKNGIFLMAIGEGGHDFCKESHHYWCQNCNAPKYRLVCVSDLGLSVRTNANGLGVWVTSLTNGRPVPKAKVEVFSSANVKVLEGLTDANGWCVPAWVQKGQPFAVIVTAADGTDRTFLAIRDRMRIDETYGDGRRPVFLMAKECTGFAWTERGIYRHDEKIFFHLILRDGEMNAPKPFPVTLQLVNPKGNVFVEKTALPDRLGALAYEGFSVPADQPSGKWRIRAKLPGRDGAVLAEREVKIEEFAPPQIRVKVKACEGVHPTNFAFAVSAEHLFGGPAATLACEGAVVFEDVAFAPEAWKGYHFGNDDLGLKPCFRELGEETLDAAGKVRFTAPIWADSGRPKAMVRATGQGIVFEDGGRPATSRASALLHYYPYYIGSTLTGWVRRPENGTPKVALACVTQDGKRVGTSKKLTLKLERIDSVYSYRRGENGWNTWDCERIRSLAADDIEFETRTDADTEVALPVSECGDYVLTVSDSATGVSYARTFYLSAWGDETVRAPLANPTEVTLRPDKAAYRVGEAPRLVIKSPFTGFAMLSVLREKERYTEILKLTNATSEVVLRPVSREDAPNLDVYISVVQSVMENAKHLAVRAHGQTTVRVKPAEYEMPVKVTTKVIGTREVRAAVAAPGAASVVVTLVDEGINLLTGEPTPDPINAFARVRTAEHPLFDLYGKILPVDGAALKANGIKTGGDCGAEMLGRVSPVGTRRFKPLARWQVVPVKDGRAEALFTLPEFVGEVRVTAVAYSSRATGAASAQQKITPRLVAQPDAPRFVAPDDRFDVTLPLHNRSGAAGEVKAKINDQTFRFMLTKDASTNLIVRLIAPSAPGDFSIVYVAEGFGERHEQTIALPVRPAVAWVETAGVEAADAKSSHHQKKEGMSTNSYERYSERIFDSPLGEYEAALRWLAEYRHGCLEQTCSRVFPLIAAGGILNAVVTNAPDAVAVGVRRVESMIRERDFVMWPDCGEAPWNREVSLYAAHFLVAAEKSGARVNAVAKRQVMKFLNKWVDGKDANVSAYAALVLAIAGEPEKDRMFRLYDDRAKLSALARSRLALAFAVADDLPRARTLLADVHEPQSIKEAAFVAMARTAVDPKDAKILPLLMWLNAKRDRAKNSWGTTEENAHALLAMGAYYQANPPKKGEKFVAWRKLTLPKLGEVKDESNGIFIERTFRTVDAKLANLAGLRCGQLLIAELTVTSAVSRVMNDLVIEDLFAGAFDSVHRELDPEAVSVASSVPVIDDWVMRMDARDDRMLIFSKKFKLEAGHAARIFYPVRVVSAGEFVLPGASVEGMYDPALHALRAPGRVVVRP